MALSNRVLTTTQTKLWDKVQDTILTSNVVATRIMTAPKPWSGRQIEKPVKTSKNTQFSTFSGMEVLADAPVDNTQKMVWDATFAHIPVTLPGTELSLNATTERVIDLMSFSLVSSTQDMADGMGSAFYGNGLGDASAFAGLGYLIDDGTVSATIGGLSRTTYPTLVSDVTAAAGGVISLDKMATQYDAASSGAIRPSIIATTKAGFSLYEKLLTPQERINKTVTFTKDKRHGGAGFVTADYRGTPVVADEKCTTGQYIFINEDTINWYALDVAKAEMLGMKSAMIEGNNYSTSSNMGFAWSNFVKPTNVYALVSHIFAAGQFIVENPRYNSKITDVTTT